MLLPPSEFEIPPDLIETNHGAFGRSPSVVRKSRALWLETVEEIPTRFFSLKWPHLARQKAEKLAQWLGGNGVDWVFAQNATAACQSVFNAVEIEPGQEIIVTDHCYPSVATQARLKCRAAGGQLKTVNLPFPDLTPEKAKAAIESALTPNTALVVVDHVSSPTGLVLPVAEIAGLCRQRGISLLIDGAHAPGQIEALDVPAIGADFYVANLHKWAFAPRSCGVMWVAGKWQDKVRPVIASHTYERSFAAAFDWQGTFDPTPILAIDTALEFGERLGWDNIVQQSKKVCRAYSDAAATMLDTQAVTPKQMSAFIRSVQLPFGAWSREDELEARKFALAAQDKLLIEHSIIATVMPFANTYWLRISGAPYLDLDMTDEFARRIHSWAQAICATASENGALVLD